MEEIASLRAGIERILLILAAFSSLDSRFRTDLITSTVSGRLFAIKGYP